MNQTDDFLSRDGTGAHPGHVTAPLLCWDIAHPLLNKYQKVVHDLEAFAQLKSLFDWQFTTDLRPLLLDNTTVIVTDRATRILWVSDGFSGLTGYQPVEVLGKNPAFLQGPLTGTRAKNALRQKLANGQSVAVKVLNYRKEGTPYWCQVAIQPLLNSQHECTHFVAFEKELVSLKVTPQ